MPLILRLLVITLLFGFSATSVHADIPALCAPAKARHDKAMASGDRGAVTAARERIKVLANACPQLWAAVRNAPMPRAKEEAKAISSPPKSAPKSPSTRPSSTPKVGIKFMQYEFDPVYRFDEEPIRQTATNYAGDGDVMSAGYFRWFLMRTQEGCYFFEAGDRRFYDTKGLAFAKQFLFQNTLYHWNGQCTPGKLITGSGVLNRHQWEPNSGLEIRKTSGTMIDGLWDGYYNNQVGLKKSYSTYSKGCEVLSNGSTQMTDCRPPRIAPELRESAERVGNGAPQPWNIKTAYPSNCRWILDGEWMDAETGNKVRVEMRPGGLITWFDGQTQNAIAWRNVEQTRWKINDQTFDSVQLEGGGYLRIWLTLPGLLGKNYQRINPAMPPACVGN